jgi:hypothetical protein
MKIDAKMAPKSHQKSLKIGHWGTPGSIFSVFNGFWAVSKKHDFSMPLRGVKKARKMSLGTPKKPKMMPRPISVVTRWCRGAPGHRVKG